MNIRTTARHFSELNAPSSELMDKTLYLMRGAQQDGQEKARRSPALRRLGVAASAMAAALVLLVGTNLAFPALAENLPIVGSVFQFLNDRSRLPVENLNAAYSSISEYAVDVSGDAGSTVTVPARNVLERAITAQLKEVYYDGSFIFAGLELQLGKHEEGITEIARSNYDIIINGEPQVRHEDGQVAYPSGTGNGFCDLSDYFLTKVNDDSYVMKRAFRVPNHLQGADTLEVELRFDGFLEGLTPINSSGFSFSFTAHKKELPTTEISCSGMEMNGVRLLSATSNPMVTYLEIEYPETYNNPACGAAFDDGISIGFFGGEESRPENGVVRDMEALAGLRDDETRSIVWRLFDKKGSDKYEAVFVIDFANGTVRLGSEEDIKSPPVGDYACGVEAIQNLQDGYIVEKYHAEQDKPMLYLANGNGKQEDLWIEVWQDGELVDSVNASRKRNSWRGDFLYWEYVNEEWFDGTEHTACMVILPNGYTGLDLTHPLTVKAYNAARELVLDQEITLTVREG